MKKIYTIQLKSFKALFLLDLIDANNNKFHNFKEQVTKYLIIYWEPNLNCILINLFFIINLHFHSGLRYFVTGQIFLVGYLQCHSGILFKCCIP